MQDPLYQRYIVPVVREIETNFSSDLTAQALSEKVFVSPQYLSRLFRRFFSCSVYEYLTMHRINKAKRAPAGKFLLKSTGHRPHDRFFRHQSFYFHV